MIRLIIKAILILVSLAAIGWWSVQNDDDTRGEPREHRVGELSSVPYGLRDRSAAKTALMTRNGRALLAKDDRGTVSIQSAEPVEDI